MSELNRVNHSRSQEVGDFVMFAQTIDGELVMTKMPRVQAEALQKMASVQPVEYDYSQGAASTVEVPNYEDWVDAPAATPLVEQQFEADDSRKSHLGRRVAKVALIGSLVIGPFVAGDYLQTTMMHGEIPGPEVIIEDMGQLSGQLVEAGQNFGGFVEQVKGMVDTFGRFGGGK